MINKHLVSCPLPSPWVSHSPLGPTSGQGGPRVEMVHLPCIHPPKDFNKVKKGVWRRGLKDLMGWITKGRDHVYGGLLSGGFLQEGEGKPEVEVVQTEQRKEKMWVTVMESMEIGWTFSRGFRWQDRVPSLRIWISESTLPDHWKL